MFTSMGTSQSSINYANYCDIQNAVRSGKTVVHIMDVSDETILIKGTLTAYQEVEKINLWISNGAFDNEIYIYGYSNADFNKLLQRHKQLLGLGFHKVYIYFGGMFEWLLLRDVYGATEFPLDGLIKGAMVDILKYNKPCETMKT